KTCAADLSALADLEPSNPGFAYSLAWLLLCGPDEVRDPAGGLRAAEQAAARWPENVWVRTVLALAWYRNGKARQARAALAAVREQATLRLEPFVLFTLALCQQELGDAGEARRCLDRARRWHDSRDLFRPLEVVELENLEAEASRAPGPDAGDD